MRVTILNLRKRKIRMKRELKFSLKIKNKQLGEIAKISFVLKFDDSNC